MSIFGVLLRANQFWNSTIKGTGTMKKTCFTMATVLLLGACNNTHVRGNGGKPYYSDHERGVSRCQYRIKRVVRKQLGSRTRVNFEGASVRSESRNRIRIEGTAHVQPKHQADRRLSYWCRVDRDKNRVMDYDLHWQGTGGFGGSGGHGGGNHSHHPGRPGGETSHHKPGVSGGSGVYRPGHTGGSGTYTPGGSGVFKPKNGDTR